MSATGERRVLDEARGVRAMVWIIAIMLFLTVLAAPILLEKLDPLEMAKAIGLGALYFGAIVKVLTMLSAPKTG